MAGFWGRALRIDLNRGRFTVEELDTRLFKDYIGGRGLAIKIFSDGIDPKVDPLSPDNKLIIATGPLTGTGALCSCEFFVVTKSPLTNGIAYSGCDGNFGTELKFAGYDLMIVEGKASYPVFISINNGKVEILSASHLWGNTTHQAEEQIRAEWEDPWQARECSILGIGPSGERLSKIASIVNDKFRMAARSGVGAVMGSKNLKAIAVKGSKDLTLTAQETFTTAAAEALSRFKTTPVVPQALRNLGTPFLVSILNQRGVLPYRNFQSGIFEDAHQVSGELIAETIQKKSRACYACPIGCRKVVELGEPDLPLRIEGADYDALGMLGIACGISNVKAVERANSLCLEFGIDPISTGSVIALAMELFEKKIIKEGEIGYPLTFGNAEAMVESVKRIGQCQQGFSEKMGEGGFALAQRYRHPELFMGVKRQEMPPYDPRGIQGLGLHFATSSTGASHVNGFTLISEIFGIRRKVDPLSIEGKPLLVKEFQEVTAVSDSSGLCPLLLWGIWIDEILPMLEGVVGLNLTLSSLLKAGERIWNLERLFNLKAGFTAKDDALPMKFLNEPMKDGPAKGKVCELKQMLPEYYELRGWDREGRPLTETIKRLSLK
jgi:aldehyde:ferredoxin oxidoreductase